MLEYFIPLLSAVVELTSGLFGLNLYLASLSVLLSMQSRGRQQVPMWSVWTKETRLSCGLNFDWTEGGGQSVQRLWVWRCWSVAKQNGDPSPDPSGAGILTSAWASLSRGKFQSSGEGA